MVAGSGLDLAEQHLRFAPDILRRLGEELIPSPEQGVLELVRNAYDADSRTCTIELQDIERPGGTLIVRDDGNGMRAEDITDGWLVLGRSRKSAGTETNRYHRTPVGDKGLGRLAALRLGTKATLCTRPSSSPNVEYFVELDWSMFDNADVVEDVPIIIVERQTTEPCGTTVKISGLRMKLGLREIKRLTRALVLIADPFGDHRGFRPELRAQGFEQFERRVKAAYFEDAEYHLHAHLDELGCASAEVLDWKGEVLWTAEHHTLREYSTKALSRRRLRAPRGQTQLQLGGQGTTAPPYDAPAAEFDLWAFLLQQDTYNRREVGITELREWLEAVGGVHLYHRGLRVHPYGDPGHDWLDMNLARARNPELRPSTNTSLGRVVVPDRGEKLLQKTDRTGFVENEAFHELQRFAQDCLEWMADMRLRARDARIQAERVSSPRRVERAKITVAEAVQEVPSAFREKLDAAIKQLQQAHEREVRSVKGELELYRTLGTVGTTVAIFAHENGKPVTRIESMASMLDKRAQQLPAEEYERNFEQPIRLILKAARALSTFAALPLNLLGRNKRRTGRIDIHAVVRESVEMFLPFAKDVKITMVLDLMDGTPHLRGTVSGVQAIVTNLLTNAISALKSPEAPLRNRRIEIRSHYAGGRLLLRVLDNGPGIRDISTEDIWLPGKTTREDGTGLGLTIVRDTVRDFGGRVSVAASGELGGAEFLVELPILESA